MANEIRVPTNREHSQVSFDFKKLQDDVIKEFIVGKPFISQDMRVPFKFRKPRSSLVRVGISEAEVAALSNHIPQEFKVYIHKK